MEDSLNIPKLSDTLSIEKSSVDLDKAAIEGEVLVSKGVKRPADDNEGNDAEPAKMPDTGGEHGSVVAAHYNHLEEKGLKERFNSPIFYLRNFNNWVKSVMIQEYTDKLREKDYGRALRVLDICCGKGGDLGKWQKARVESVIFADIAAVSVEQCEARYEDLKRRCGRLFSAEFLAADCTKEALRDKFRDPSVRLDLTSCQFGFHYCFESLPQARRMLRNVADCLRPDGCFVGTIPNAHEIVARARTAGGAFGNKIYNIKLMFDPEKDGYPLFGAKYDFHLEGVVDCPEFLVNFDTFVKLAEEYGLELIYKAPFAEFFEQHRERYRQLLHRIMSLECFPPARGRTLIADEAEYEHARAHLAGSAADDGACVGTMSRCEWEVATLYMAFAFKKCKSTWDAAGKPVYSRAEASKPPADT